MQFPGKGDIRRAALAALGFAEMQCEAHDIELWQTSLHASAARINRLVTLLAPDEIQRAGRFRSPDDRRRFTVARGMLRLLLGHYLNSPPAGLEFRYGKNGKPALRERRKFHFNLAHSGERAVYAVSAAHPVGIDIEYVARDVAFERVARRFFTDREFAALIKIPATRRRRAFYRLWTAKEAVIKATGKGLAQSLAGFEIDLASNHGANLQQSKDGPDLRTSIYAPLAGRDYIVTVAVSSVERLRGQSSSGAKHTFR